jgi:hypothetical protein
MAFRWRLHHFSPKNATSAREQSGSFIVFPRGKPIPVHSAPLC